MVSENQITVTVDSPLGQWLLAGKRSERCVFATREPEMQFPRQTAPTAVDLVNAAIARKWREAGMKTPPNPSPSIPQSSTTPPMWAQDPTRSRRPRRNRNQPTRQGIA